MWYQTREEAEEAVKWKEKEYGYSFYVLEERIEPMNSLRKFLSSDYIYWAQRIL